MCKTKNNKSIFIILLIKFRGRMLHIIIKNKYIYEILDSSIAADLFVDYFI